MTMEAESGDRVLDWYPELVTLRQSLHLAHYPVGESAWLPLHLEFPCHQIRLLPARPNVEQCSREQGAVRPSRGQDLRTREDMGRQKTNGSRASLLERWDHHQLWLNHHY